MLLMGWKKRRNWLKVAGMSAQAAEIGPADIRDENLPVGEILRRARVYYNQSVDDVGGILRIRSSHLEAIEQNRIDDLPGRVYAFGFVRAYAEYLGLDGEKIVKLFKSQIGAPVNDRPDLHMPVAASESKSPNMFIIIGSLVVLAAGVFAMMYTGEETREEEAKVADIVHEIPPVPQELYEDTGAVGPFQPAAAVTQQAAAAAQAEVAAAQGAQTASGPMATSSAPAAERPLAPANMPVILKLKDSAWVEIRDVSGKALLSRILKPGDSYIVPATVKGLVLDTGNVGALEFTVEGKVLSAFGGKGDVRRGIKLEPDFLKDLDARNARRAAPTAPPAASDR